MLTAEIQNIGTHKINIKYIESDFGLALNVYVCMVGPFMIKMRGRVWRLGSIVQSAGGPEESLRFNI